MTTLQDALTIAGITEQYKVLPIKDRTTQIFKVTFTKFEIPILIKVRCDKEDQGLKFVAGFKLNSIEAESQEEAQIKINQKLTDIQYNMKGTDEGCPLYWKFYK